MAPAALFILIGLGLIAASAIAPQSPPNEPGDTSPDTPPVEDPTQDQPIDEPVVIDLNQSEIIIQPYNWGPPSQIVLTSDWDLNMIPAYVQMVETMKYEATIAAQETGISYGAIMYRTGWQLLWEMEGNNFKPSIWMIGLAQVGFTPLQLWLQKLDAISALSILLHGEATQKPPSVPGPSNASYLENFNWSNPKSNSNYRAVMYFLTGVTYASEELLDTCSCGGDLDFLFNSQMTLQMAIIWRNLWNQVPSGQGNFNFPH